MAILRSLCGEMILVQGLELRKTRLMEDHMLRFLEELRYAILLSVQMGRFLENLGNFHREGYLVQIVQLIEAPLFVCQMVYLREASLLESQMGRLLGLLQ